MFVLQQGRPLSDLLVVGFGETCKGRSQFELVMGGGVLSLGLAAGGPLQTLNKERGTDKKDSWTMGLLQTTAVSASSTTFWDNFPCFSIHSG